MSDRAHILVIDDDPRIRQMLSRYFEGEGFRVSPAENGTAMRACLDRTKVDLVLLDLVFPGEDGIQLAKEIRSRSVWASSCSRAAAIWWTGSLASKSGPMITLRSRSTSGRCRQGSGACCAACSRLAHP